ncbi:MAG: acyltransferase [Gammaproteobacteria bacterium]|nr:acyltransferase [Gammaproteobacteria bacterium]MCP5136783.1 acyltransferase [Gammaproteobacteria bacterium]
MYLNSFNHFRALAIAVIVASHTIWTCGWQFDSVAERFALNLVSGGSTLFVFISGFLYHHIFYRRSTPYAQFMRDKLRNVLTPYLVLSIPTLWIFLMFPRWAVRAPIFADPDGGLIGTYLVPFLMDLLTGYTTHAYWYIPFVLLLFGLSPVFDRVIRAPAGVRWALFAGGLAISMLIHRPVENINPLQSLVYFSPVYVFGILCSIHRERVYRMFKGSRVYGLLIAALGLALGRAVWMPQVLGNFHKPAFAYGGIDTMILQGLALCVFFMVWLARYESRQWRAVHLLASGSFAIYFIHPLLLVFAGPLVHIANVGHAGYDWMMTTALTLVLSFAIARGVQAAWPTGSRRLIGW